MSQPLTSTLSQRFQRLPTNPPTNPLTKPPTNPLTDTLHLRPGSLRDYAKLAAHHYRGSRPATAPRVLVLEHNRPSLSSRFLSQAADSGEARRLAPPRPGLCQSPPQTKPADPASSSAKAHAEHSVVGVLVESLPALSCTMRNHAFDNRFGPWLAPRQRAAVLNDEVRCISRVVVAPPWRGLGLAVKLVCHALDSATTPFTEALAVMGQVNPFFERAGMRAYHRPPHRADARLIAALEAAGFTSTELVMAEQIIARIQGLPTPQQTWLKREFKRWFNQRGQSRNKRQTAQQSPAQTMAMHVTAAQHSLLFQPVYYLHDNR